MALRETLELDLGRAQADIDELERSLDRLNTSIEVGVDVNSRGLDIADRESEDLRQELGRVEDAADRVADEGDRIGREYKEGTGKAEKGLKGMGTAMKGFIAIAATGLVADRIINFGKAAVGAASDLAESTSKAEVVFGDFADRIFRFTDTAPEALRLSTQEALEMTGTFGNLFVALGLSQQAAADLAPDIVQLGADLGSFNNIEVGEVLEKLRSGLVGEAEPLRVLGVNLDAATTKAKAFELGLGDANGIVDAAGLVQARWALILEQTVTAQGDAARTADTFAGAAATLAAKFEDLKASVGEALLPALLEILPIIEQLVDQLGPKLAGAVSTTLKYLSATAGIFDKDARHFANYLGVMEQLNEDWIKNKDAASKFHAGLKELDRVASLTEDNFLGVRKALGLTAEEAIRGAEATREWLEAQGIPTDEIVYWIGSLRSELAAETLALAGAEEGMDAWEKTHRFGVDTAEDLVGAVEQSVDALDGYEGLWGDLTKNIDAANRAQQTYITTLRGLADPVYRAIQQFGTYQELIDKLDDGIADTTEEQLELAIATWDTRDAFAALDDSALEAAVMGLAAALEISKDEAGLLLAELGLLDGQRFAADFDLRFNTIGEFPDFDFGPGRTFTVDRSGELQAPAPGTSTFGDVIIDLRGAETPDLPTSLTRIEQIFGSLPRFIGAG